MNIDYQVYVYDDKTNTGRATYIHPTSGYVWVDLDNGRADFIHPDHVTTIGDEVLFRLELALADA